MRKLSGNKMESENTEQTPESGSQQSQDSREETPKAKLRDLRPEKDPMGAGPAKPPGDAAVFA